MFPPNKNPLRFLPDRIVTALATCGPVGFWGKAPGTNGTVVGLLLYTVAFHQLGIIGQLVLLALFIWLGVLICDEGERRMGKHDPGEMIIDEIVAIPLCFIGLNSLMAQTGGIWIYMLAGFILFRFFDILKPLGIYDLQKYPRGVGVMLDDFAAALATNLLLRLCVGVYLLN
jgi:phosphatidylglycerophosphatase A